MADIKSEKDQLSSLENLFQQKRFSDALDIAKNASSDYPNSFQIRLFYVRILKELNKLGEAEEVLKELMLIYPNNIKLLLESGNLALLRNKFDEAFEFYNKILFLDPFNTEAKKSIDKIDIIKKNGFVEKGKNVDFVSLQNEQLQTADTLPEFDSRKLRDIIEKEPPPPPPLPPFADMKDMKVESKKEEKSSPPPTPPPVIEPDEEQGHEIRFKKRVPEQENDVTELPPPLTGYERLLIPEEDKKIIGHEQKTEAREIIQEQKINLKTSPPPIPDTADAENIPGISSIPASPIEKEPKKPTEPPPIPGMENQENAGIRNGAKKPWSKEPGIEELTDEAGFVTESAAKLYVEQGLLMDAVAIYEKLYNSRKEKRYLSKIIELKRQHVNQRSILVLNELLKQIKQKGEKIV